MAKKKIASDFQADWDSNPFRKPRIEKVVVNISVGKAGEELEKAAKVLEMITDRKPVKLKAKKSVKEWSIRKGQNIAVKVTLRKDDAINFIKRVLFVNDGRILRSSFDNKGNVSIGVDEHIKLPKAKGKGNVKYIPELGIFGFDCAIRIVRPGFRVKTRRKMRSKIAKNHYVSRLEAQYFMQKNFGVEIVDEMKDVFY
ncbi:MAG: 50S ribosomal protein L5 [Promethearchaeota archaeon]